QPVNLPELVPIVTERPQFSRQRDVPLQQVLELKPMEQKDLLKFIEFNAKKTWPQYCQQDKDTTQGSSVSKASGPENEAPDLIFSPQGQNGDKWQYLHHELSSKIKLPPPQLVEPQENMTEETYNDLDKKLFELFLSLNRCLGSVEEMLQTP
uniref:Uncharacterized protein n=1 Tax=Ictidomys tridecemlineatus TaxID=43179 RepID=A0A287DAN9_ICTTR